VTEAVDGRIVAASSPTSTAPTLTGPTDAGRPVGSRSAPPAGPPTGRGPFRWTAYALAVTSFAAAVPTPLYPVYEHQLGFSAAVLGLMFAAYTPGVLLTLLLLAPKADRLGRKRFLYLGLGLTALASVAFGVAPDVAVLAIARFTAGLAVGATTSVATAAMTDLEPNRDPHHVARVAVAANFGGFAIGVVASSILVEFAPDPTQLVYVLPVLAGLVGILAIRSTPETAPSLGAPPPPRRRPVVLPPEMRRAFWVAVGGIAACYSIYGLFAALVPSYVRSDLGLAAAVDSGAVVAAMFGTAALVQLATSQIRDRRALLVGLPLLLVALLALVTSLRVGAWGLLLAVAAVLGTAVGLTFMGSATLVDRIAPEEHRAGVLAVYYSAGYLSLAGPTIGIAAASESLGLATAGVLFGGLLAAVTAVLYIVIVRTPTPAGGGGRPRPGVATRATSATSGP
jgi:MFS family permease